MWECRCACHSSDGLMKYCMPCCGTCKKCFCNVKFGFEEEHGKECKPLPFEVFQFNLEEQAVVNDAKDLMEKVLARIEQSTKQYGTNYVLADVMKETEEEWLDIIGWPLLAAVRAHQLRFKKLGQLNGKYLDKFLESQTPEYLSHLKEKIDAELVKRQQ